MLIVLQVTATFKLSLQTHFKVQSRFTYQYQVHLQNKNQITVQILRNITCVQSHIHFKIFFVATRQM